MRTPDFANLLAVLDRRAPSRPTLFEFFMNDPLYRVLAGPEIAGKADAMAPYRTVIHAFKNAGYDYATIPQWYDNGSTLNYPRPEVAHKATVSINDGSAITDRESFNTYRWCDPDPAGYAYYGAIASELPPGMKAIAHGPGGVLENVVWLVGYERLCYMLFEDEPLAADIFEAVGSRMVRHYEILGKFDTIGALISNDDWGFKTQTMLPPDAMRKLVFPWHRKIVQTIHAAGKPAILHSCGNLDAIMDEIIDDIGYDGKHSYEDNILPVEGAYEKWGRRIAILGGLDLDFVVRSAPEAIHERAGAMLDRSAGRGGYALGTGNSVPDYVPEENYRAMIASATGEGWRTMNVGSAVAG
jgi:uroporphyrinogen decarboxylase